jgi:hypothetical protein
MAKKKKKSLEQEKIDMMLDFPALHRPKPKVTYGEEKAVEVKHPTKSALAARAQATHGESRKNGK